MKRGSWADLCLLCFSPPPAPLQRPSPRIPSPGTPPPKQGQKLLCRRGLPLLRSPVTIRGRAVGAQL